ncbi:F-box protein SKIP23-like [Mercurialis annua]|uniref:F-box protein SKIP23-like n=1 Tax=Mercurialis annua TaxID=3986 RepID=UPI0021604C27|nr:F-box protein SKIP23-like [Mercurialis annua]
MEIKRTLSSTSDTSIKTQRLSSSTTSNSTNWSDLVPELLQLILSKLLSVQIIRFKSVCSSWNRVAESYISSSFYTPLVSETPCLLLPAQDYDPDDCHYRTTDSRCFYSLEDKKEYNLTNMSNLFNYRDCCIGSSHGWLILLHNSKPNFPCLLNSFSNVPNSPFLVNPFSKVRIELPLLNWHQVEDEYVVFSKAILLSDPSHDKDFRIVLIKHEFHFSKSFFFFKKGDPGWITVDNDENKFYIDIISRDNHLYALTTDFCIEAWDFRGDLLPVKIRKIHPSITENLSESLRINIDLYVTQSYLVDSCGDLLLAVRFIGNFVNQEGEVVDESHLVDDELNYPLVSPYQTKMFHVYKLDSSEQNWIEVDNLHNQVLLVGLNQSMSFSAVEISGCQRNSIYFSDDNWEEMRAAFSHGGHDFGVFSLKNKSVELFNWHNLGRINPSPIWIIPNPW